MAEREAPLITKDGMHRILDSIYNDRDMQTFISVMTHAQTCKDCYPFYIKAIEIAKHHIENELR